MNKPCIRITLAISVLFFTNACGWQLRGLEKSSDAAIEQNQHTANNTTHEKSDDENKTTTAQPTANDSGTTASNNNTSSSTDADNAPSTANSARPIQSDDVVASVTKRDHAETKTREPGLRLIMRERNHGLASALKRSAWDNQIHFAERAETWLIIESEKLEKRPLTVTETGVAAQYQLILTLTFSQKRANGETILASQKIVSWRAYDFDAKLIVAKAHEEEALILEMREELSQRILSLVNTSN